MESNVSNVAATTSSRLERKLPPEIILMICRILLDDNKSYAEKEAERAGAANLVQGTGPQVFGGLREFSQVNKNIHTLCLDLQFSVVSITRGHLVLSSAVVDINRVARNCIVASNTGEMPVEVFKFLEKTG